MFGILNLHKPSGPTSRDCVNVVQRVVNPIKVGHAGTLDPIATGVLLVLVGQAVRLTDDVHELDKEYLGTFQLGATSPSADIETEMQSIENAPVPTLIELREISKRFKGQIEQSPPAYSAIRFGGKRAHELARAGKDLAMPTRHVTVNSIEVVDYSYPIFRMIIQCGTGTYVRSLGRDIARMLGSDAVMTSLVRTRIGPFAIQQSHMLDAISTASDVQHRLRSPLESLPLMQRITLSDTCLKRFKDGQRMDLTGVLAGSTGRAAALDALGNLHAIIRFEPSEDVWKTEKYFWN